MVNSRGGVRASDQDISDLLDDYPNFPNPTEADEHRTYADIVTRLGPNKVDQKTYDITTQGTNFTARPQGQKTGTTHGTLGERVRLGTNRNSHDYVLDEIDDRLLVEYLGRSDNHNSSPDRQIIRRETNDTYNLTIPALPVTHMATPQLRNFAKTLYDTAQAIHDGTYEQPQTNQMNLFNK